MKIHEYQGKAILAEYGVTVPRGKVCFSVDEAVVSRTIALCLTDGVSFEVKSEGLARVFMASSSSESIFKERLGKTESFD